MKFTAAAALVLSASLTAAPIDDLIQKQLTANRLTGASVAVVRDGKLIHAKGYGMANVELSTPATENTVYQLASITKQFTATAILMLVEEGKLSLDSRLNTVLDGMPAAWSGVTIRHLLNHTSGIKSYTGVPDFPKTLRKDYQKEELIRTVSSLPLDFQPGEKFLYNNTGYYLLGMIVEKVSGKDYGPLLNEKIFQPLDMTSTRLNDLRDIVKDRASGYEMKNGRLQNGEYVSPTQPFSAGALLSTVLDMAKWDAALYSEKLLKKSSLDQMETPTKLNDGSTQPYGFGWVIDTYRERKRIGHGGGIQGFSTQISRFVDDKLTVVALVNQEGSSAERLANAVAEFYIPALQQNAPKPITDNDTKLTKFLRDVFTTIAQGTGDETWFTPEFAKVLFPDRVKQGKQMMGQFGELKSFELMEEKTQGDKKVRSYTAVFGITPLRCLVTLTGDGKIAGLGVRPE